MGETIRVNGSEGSEPLLIHNDDEVNKVENDMNQ